MDAAATPEFSRPLRLDQLGGSGERVQTITADAAERLALQQRFRLRGLDRLEADYVLSPVAGGWRATGTLRAEAVQSCVASDRDVPETINVPFAIDFVEAAQADAPVEEIELSEDDCDVMAIEDGRLDMGEAVAQTLALNLDPYPRSPDSADYLREMGVKQEGEMGALSGLKDLLAKGKDD